MFDGEYKCELTISFRFFILFMFLTCDELTRTHTLVSISLASEISGHGKSNSKSETSSGVSKPNTKNGFGQNSDARICPNLYALHFLVVLMSFTGYYAGNFIQELGLENEMILIGQVIG